LHKCGVNKELKKICDHLTNLDSLYTIEIDEKEIKNPHIHDWITNLLKIDAGELVLKVEGGNQPVSFYPLLKIQDDVNSIRWNHSNDIGGELIYNLNEISIHVNGSENGNNLYARQTLFPLNTSENISFENIEKIVIKWKAGKNIRLNLIGDILSYPQLSEIISLIKSQKIKVNSYILGSDIIHNNEKLTLLNSLASLNLYCDNISHFSVLFDLVKKIENELLWIFPIVSEECYSKINELIKKFSINHYNIIPLYNGENIDFFKKNIFINEDDFADMSLTKREIFIRQSVNTNFFGKLIILPDTKVYANLDQQPIGTIRDTLYNLVYKEMITGNAWRMKRESKPCTSCVYQWLCPVPSNYEIVIGYHNLCHIKQ
jgi:pseudo-rSAM protein